MLPSVTKKGCENIGLFHKRHNKTNIEPVKNVLPYIIKSSTTKKTFETNDLEIEFFNTLYNGLTEWQNKGIHLTRMYDGTLDVYLYTYPIGKVKLQGHKHSIQVLKGEFGVKVYEDDISSHINEWIKYMNWVVK